MNRHFLKHPVFLISSTILILLITFGLLFSEQFEDIADALFNWTTTYFGWFYLLAIFAIVVFLLGLAFTSYGSIKLGNENSKPEFSFFSWIGMLFSAGFGAGLVFWGVAEPMSHYFAPPFEGIGSKSEEAARISMGYAFFHQGISQWSVFALMGLAIAFLQFKKKKDGLVSTALTPIIGHNKTVKHSVDILAVISTVMGVATSVGLGVLQMNGGLNIAFNTPQTLIIQMILIVIMAVAYLFSTTTGLKKGIKYLSTLNLGMAIGLLAFVFFTGPTLFILETFTLAIGDFIDHFVSYSLRLEPYVEGKWVKDWTIFYWAWAIAWSPFVGAFVARVSKGRTIREFILGVMIIPPLIAAFWIAVFGGTALYNDMNNGTMIAEAVDQDLTQALFVTFDTLPMTGLLNGFAIILIFTFLVTSADSATYILASMTSGGSSIPPLANKVVWGTIIAATSLALLSGGGLDALQTASLVSALPFTIILVLLIFSILSLLKNEMLPIEERDIQRFEKLQERVEENNND